MVDHSMFSPLGGGEHPPTRSAEQPCIGHWWQEADQQPSEKRLLECLTGRMARFMEVMGQWNVQ